MQNSMVLFTFSVSVWNTLFGQIWPRKSRLSLEAEIWYLHQFEYPEFNGGVHSFYFWSKIPFLGKFGPKSQNYQSKLKFSTYNNSNMQNSMVIFTFFPFWLEIPYLGKFGPKNKNYQSKLKFGAYNNLNMQNSVVIFTFSLFD